MMWVGRHGLEVLRAGPENGKTLLLIHGINPVSPKAPSHPGFGGSPLPPDFDTMYDLVNLYRDVLDTLPDRHVSVAGFGFGGWIAAELAVAGHPKLDRLILVDAFGVKLGNREDRDFAHLFNTNPAELHQRTWHDPARRPAGIYGLGWQATISDEMSDAEMVTLARNWDSLCLFAWRPHLFNPQLKHWLHRVRVPTLVLWGESDGVVPLEYGRRYANLIQGAVFETIPQAGHHPELEQPDAFVSCMERFLP
jgi:pimeloyl-ACP methyl ester carboxylesterase